MNDWLEQQRRQRALCFDSVEFRVAYCFDRPHEKSTFKLMKAEVSNAWNVQVPVFTVASISIFILKWKMIIIYIIIHTSFRVILCIVFYMVKHRYVFDFILFNV